MPACPNCQQSTKQVRSGMNDSGSQRYLCRHCQRKYTPESNSSGFPAEIRKQAVLMALEGKSFRAIAKALGVNHQSVANWVDDYIAKSARAIYKLPK
jgi:transposase-like protein